MHQSMTPGARRSRRPLAWLTATLAASALALGGAQAATAAPASSTVTHTVGASASATSAYWTSDRMEAAVDADRLVAGQSRGASQDVAAGAPATVPGRAPQTSAKPQPVSVAPVAHIGKVFFTLGGVDYVCSGNSVVSANERTVSTAGHCLNEGPGAFATNFVFAPAYENGSTPFGVWTATELHAPSQWVSGGDIDYDTGFAVVASPAGSSATLSDTVGASGVAFNQARGLSYTAYGYPAARPFDGQTLETCSGTARNDAYGTQSQGIPCDMTGGSSGGPWFIGSGAAGVQNSVNSFGYSTVRNTMFGPYWGSVIQSAYQAAQS
ncbi:trypsin-like serine peptidase [Agrococcus terreus]|uniref:Peptidase n=1 Tax=Agrococcus terreus TaxID=574649 RepID=A0ABQ2KQ51_9MICO|nr:peptidase [Agrococcus terreus]